MFVPLRGRHGRHIPACKSARRSLARVHGRSQPPPDFTSGFCGRKKLVKWGQLHSRHVITSDKFHDAITDAVAGLPKRPHVRLIEAGELRFANGTLERRTPRHEPSAYFSAVRSAAVGLIPKERYAREPCRLPPPPTLVITHSFESVGSVMRCLVCFRTQDTTEPCKVDVTQLGHDIRALGSCFLHALWLLHFQRCDARFARPMRSFAAPRLSKVLCSGQNVKRFPSPHECSFEYPSSDYQCFCEI